LGVPLAALCRQPIGGSGRGLGRLGRDLLGREDFGGRLGSQPGQLHAVTGWINGLQGRLVAPETVHDSGELVERGTE